MDSPNRVMPYSLCDKELRNVDVLSPVYDYIPPEYVTLILTTKGGYAPSYIFRLMQECYANDDMIQPFIYSFNKRECAVCSKRVSPLPPCRSMEVQKSRNRPLLRRKTESIFCAARKAHYAKNTKIALLGMFK